MINYNENKAMIKANYAQSKDKTLEVAVIVLVIEQVHYFQKIPDVINFGHSKGLKIISSEIFCIRK